MFINRRRKELALKIVYYGPALSGKTTNLERIHAKTRPELRGELVSVKTREDRTIYFDYLQLELGQVCGLKPKFNLYTVPGQVYYAASRKLVLQGVDGIVFVADSQFPRLSDNQVALRDMHTHLRDYGYDPATLPLVVQFNKRDLPNVVPMPILRDWLSLHGSIPYFPAVAVSGEGVFDTLKAIINQVIAEVQRQI
jgi:hypothetical protein